MPSLAKNSTSVRYHKVKTVDDGFVDAQFRKPPPKPPTKAILLAVFLFTLGTLLLVIGSLLFTGYIDVEVSKSIFINQFFMLLGAISEENLIKCILSNHHLFVSHFLIMKLKQVCNGK